MKKNKPTGALSAQELLLIEQLREHPRGVRKSFAQGDDRARPHTRGVALQVQIHELRKSGLRRNVECFTVECDVHGEIIGNHREATKRAKTGIFATFC